MKPAFRYHGSKFRLASWVMEHFPPHQVYVEPFGGSAAVLLQKPRAYAEVYNDLDGDVVNFFRVVQNKSSRSELIELLQLTPYARQEFELAYEPSADPIERARRLCIRAQMGFGSAGATKGKTGFRIDCNRQYGTAMHNWLDYPQRMAAIGKRMTGVLLENRPAIDTITAHDSASTLFFVDPPYVMQTRVAGNRTYKHEMTDADHVQLLNALANVQGMVLLSGYQNDLYRESLPGWQVKTTSSRIAAARGGGVRTECLWINPAAQREQLQQEMFANYGGGSQ